MNDLTTSIGYLLISTYEFRNRTICKSISFKISQKPNASIEIGILPLEIETGRCTPIYDKTIKKNRKRLPSERICKLCDIESCEDEFHFIFICPKYNIEHISNQEQLKYIMQNHQRDLITYIKDAWFERQAMI